MSKTSKKPWYFRSTKLKRPPKTKDSGRPTVTKFEDRLARILKRNGVQYERQVRLGKYVVDFLVPPKMVLEVTGGVHKARRLRDLVRTQTLETLGYKVVI